MVYHAHVVMRSGRRQVFPDRSRGGPRVGARRTDEPPTHVRNHKARITITIPMHAPIMAGAMLPQQTEALLRELDAWLAAEGFHGEVAELVPSPEHGMIEIRCTSRCKRRITARFSSDFEIANGVAE